MLLIRESLVSQVPGSKIARPLSMKVFWPDVKCLNKPWPGQTSPIATVPPTVRKNRRRKPGLFFLLIEIVILGGTTGFAARSDIHFLWREPEEHSLGRTVAHVAEFSPVSAFALAVPKCASVRAPEALLTPDPMFPLQDDEVLVGVSFIVGSDGYVHSAFVTRSGGSEGDRAVLRAIHGWRYRPALCNGVPTDSEARVRFSVHE